MKLPQFSSFNHFSHFRNLGSFLMEKEIMHSLFNILRANCSSREHLTFLGRLAGEKLWDKYLYTKRNVLRNKANNPSWYYHRLLWTSIMRVESLYCTFILEHHVKLSCTFLEFWVHGARNSAWNKRLEENLNKDEVLRALIKYPGAEAAHGIFETSSSFHVRGRTAARV